jgi:hypothetical protein
MMVSTLSMASSMFLLGAVLNMILLSIAIGSVPVKHGGTPARMSDRIGTQKCFFDELIPSWNSQNG